MRLEVLMVLNNKTVVFRNVMPCS